MSALPYLENPAFSLLVLGPVASVLHLGLRKLGIDFASKNANYVFNVALSAVVGMLPVVAGWVSNGLPPPDAFYASAFAGIAGSGAAYKFLVKKLEGGLEEDIPADTGS